MRESFWMQSAQEFQGRIALVTGGTDGIGRDIAIGLASAGARVYICGRSETKGQATVALAPERISYIKTDLTQTSECLSLVQVIASKHGRLDYLVNNAADDRRVPFDQASQHDFDHQVNINLRPLFTVTQAALPFLQQGQGKAVCNLCTTNFMLGLAPFTLYNAMKSGIIGFSRSLARELGPEGIRVNIVSPGWVMTDKQKERYVTPQDEADLLRDQSTKRLLLPEDITPVVMFLLSSLSQGMTGQNLIVDHGKVMQ